MSVLDDYLIDPKVSLLTKTRIQAQVSCRCRERTIGEGVDGSLRRKSAAMHTAIAENTEKDVSVEIHRHNRQALEYRVLVY